jgi:hypothetical protein
VPGKRCIAHVGDTDVSVFAATRGNESNLRSYLACPRCKRSGRDSPTPDPASGSMTTSGESMDSFILAEVVPASGYEQVINVDQGEVRAERNVW